MAISLLAASCADDSEESSEPAVSERVVESVPELAIATREILTAPYSWGPGHNVAELQEVLDIEVDGWYGAATRRAHLAELDLFELTTENTPQGLDGLITFVRGPGKYCAKGKWNWEGCHHQGAGYVMVVDPNGGTALRVGVTEAAKFPRWYRDGAAIAYDAKRPFCDSDGECGIWSLDLTELDERLRQLATLRVARDEASWWNADTAKLKVREAEKDLENLTAVHLPFDGTNIFGQRISGGPGFTEFYPWGISPDGKRVLTLGLVPTREPSVCSRDPYAGKPALELSFFLQDFAGSHKAPVRLEPTGRCSSRYAWSNDGKKVAHYADGVIWLAHLDKQSFGNFESITASQLDLDPDDDLLRVNHWGLHLDWSPDGNRLAFSLGEEIHVVNADGTGHLALTQAKKDAVRDAYPAWSPDGEHIAFQRGLCLHDNPGGENRKAAENYGVPLACETEIYVMKADGTGVRQVTDNDIWDGQPDWSVRR